MDVHNQGISVLCCQRLQVHKLPTGRVQQGEEFPLEFFSMGSLFNVYLSLKEVCHIVLWRFVRVLSRRRTCQYQ